MRRFARVIFALALLLAGGTYLATPRIAVACSCVGWDLREQVAHGAAVFEGTVVQRDGNGVRVAVDRWFAGPRRAPALTIAGDFERPGVSSSCSVGSPPAAGSRWVWVAWPDEASGDFGVGTCSPLEQLFGPTNALRDEVVATFGQGTAQAVIPAAPASIDPMPIVAPLAVVAFGLGLLLVFALAARRRTT